jgi:hypothetical protein
MSAEVLLTDAEWNRIIAICPNLTNAARPSISSFISIYRRFPEYKKLQWRCDEAAKLAQKTAELIKRIERYRNDASVPEFLLHPEWQKDFEGLDQLIDVLTLWTERFQETEKTWKRVLQASRDGARTLIHYLSMIWKLDRSKEVERRVATVLEIADPSMKKKNIGWQIRTAMEKWRRLQQGPAMSDDEFFTRAELERVQESMEQLIFNREPQQK